MMYTIYQVRKNGKLIIKDEYLKSKPCKKVKSKADIFNFDDCDIEYGHTHHQMTSYIVSKDSRVDMNQLVYFGKYYRKKNLPHNLNSISQCDLEKKMKLTSMYSSQSKVMDHLGHMLPHENWVKAKDWRQL